MDQVQVAEDAEEHERHRPDQAVVAEAHDGLVGRRVEGVGQQGRRRHDVHHLVQERRAVVIENRPLFAGVGRKQHEFVTALGEAQKQRQEDRAEQQPGGHRDPDRGRSDHHPDDVTAREHHHVDDHDLLQPEAVEQVRQQVEADQQRGLPVERPGRDQRGGGKRRARRCGRRRAQSAGRHRPQPLPGMAAVLLAVAQVVEQVDGAGRGAERDEGDRGSLHRAAIQEAAGERRRRKNEHVLAPLRRPQRPEERHETVSRGRKRGSRTRGGCPRASAAPGASGRRSAGRRRGSRPPASGSRPGSST